MQGKCCLRAALYCDAERSIVPFVCIHQSAPSWLKKCSFPPNTEHSNALNTNEYMSYSILLAAVTERRVKRIIQKTVLVFFFSDLNLSQYVFAPHTHKSRRKSSQIEIFFDSVLNTCGWNEITPNHSAKNGTIHTVPRLLSVFVTTHKHNINFSALIKIKIILSHSFTFDGDGVNSKTTSRKICPSCSRISILSSFRFCVVSPLFGSFSHSSFQLRWHIQCMFVCCLCVSHGGKM